MKRKGILRRVECRHPVHARRALRTTRDGSLAWKRLGTCRAHNVVLDWCERCGSVLVKLPGGALVRHWPVARIPSEVASTDNRRRACPSPRRS